MFATFVVFVGLSVTTDAASVGAPVQKVIEMLNEMLVKGQKEKAEEVDTFEKYSRWVDIQDRDTSRDIENAKALIEKLTSAIEKAESDIKNLSAEITQLDGEIASWEADQKAATELRTSARDEYEKVYADYSESLDALDRAITVLKARSADVKQAAQLLQQTAAVFPDAQEALSALLQESSKRTAQAPSGEPEVAAYESQSGGIIDMLKKLKSKFRKELQEAEKAEMNSQQAYDMQMLDLGGNIDNAKANRNEKAELRAKLMTQAAEDKAQLADTKVSLAEDEKYLADVKATFKSKGVDFEENQKVRAEEIQALQKAIEIMSSPEVAGHNEKHFGLVQHAKSVSLLQLGTAAHRSSVKQRAALFLESRASSLSSKVLSLAAVQLAANPFAKVVEMVKNLIARLEEEAVAEAGHKAFCDEELHKNKKRRDEKTSQVAALKATLEEVKVEIATFERQIAELAAAQAELAAAMAEATELREKEKPENLQTIKDAKEAQTAVAAAVEVLQEFYSKQGGALLQVRQVPELKAYKGQQGSSTGVLGMLEVIASDFARLEAETTANEDTAQREYDEFMRVSKEDAEAKHKEEFDKSLLKDKKEHEQAMAKKDLEATQEQLDMALAYYEELKPQCIEVNVSYEERVKMREEEIKALQEAYRILNEVQ